MKPAFGRSQLNGTVTLRGVRRIVAVALATVVVLLGVAAHCPRDDDSEFALEKMKFHSLDHIKYTG